MPTDEETSGPIQLVSGLTERQWERLAFGFAALLIQQGIDTGAPSDSDEEISEWLPAHFDPELDLNKNELRKFYEEFGKRLGKIVSDLEEEAAKRD